MIQTYQPSASLFCSAAGKIVKFGSFQPAKKKHVLKLRGLPKQPMEKF